MTVRRLGALILALMLAGATATAGAATPATLPPELVSLEQKMGELKIASMRFVQRTSVMPPPSDEARKLLTLTGLQSRESGEVTTSPPAANVTFDFFGTPLTIRAVGATAFVYIRKLGAADHGGHGSGLVGVVWANSSHAT